MEKHGPSLLLAFVAAALVVVGTSSTALAAIASPSTEPAVAIHARAAGTEIAQYGGDAPPPRELQPRYEPIPPPPVAPRPERAPGSYNDEYIFGLTRSVAESTMHPAAKILIFPITVPLDLVLLPFEIIGGTFE
jgi:hypothetical protein